MKSARHAIILDIIEHFDIDTQEELAARLREQGVQLSFVGVDDRAVLRYEQFEQLVRPNTRAIVVTGASNVTGHATDLPFVAQVAKKHGLLLLVDAAQTARFSPFQAIETVSPEKKERMLLSIPLVGS